MWELSSLSALMMVETMSFSHSTSLSSHPLFSSIITICFIIFIFCPQLFPVIIFSPVIIITAILLLFLLRLGATQRSLTQNRCNSENNGSQSENDRGLPEEDKQLAGAQPDTSYFPDLSPDQNPCLEERFTAWNVRAPLDVIYEEHEGEEEEDDPSGKDSKTEMHHPNVGVERYASLSMYYLESDSDSSTDEEYTAIQGREEEEKEEDDDEEQEEEREDLIEISLVWESEFQVEEENWIEIDISPRNGGGAGEHGGTDSDCIRR